MDSIKRIFGMGNHNEKDNGRSVNDNRNEADFERDVKMDSKIDAKSSNKNDVESKGVNEDEGDNGGNIRQRNKPLNREELLQKEIENARQIRETEQQVEQYKIREKEAEAEKPPRRYPFLGESWTSGEYITGLILMMKGLIYLILFIAAVYIAENDFDLSPCNTTDLTSEENICVNTFSTIPP